MTLHRVIDFWHGAGCTLCANYFLKKVLDTKQVFGIIGDMKAVVTIQMDNQAFEQPYTCMELERVLYKIADTVARQAIDSVGHECAEADTNGNYIAKLKIVED